MPTASDRLRKQAKKVSKEMHKMNGAVKDAAQETVHAIRRNGSDSYDAARSTAYQFQGQGGANDPPPTSKVCIVCDSFRRGPQWLLAPPFNPAAGSLENGGVKRMLVKHLNQVNKYAFYNFDSYFGLGTAGRMALLEPQDQQLGLRSQRRPRVGGGHSAHSAAHASYLKRRCSNQRNNEF